VEDIGYPGRVPKVTNGIAVLPATSQAPTSVETVNAVYVGRLSSEKGLTDLLHSWRSVKARTTRPIKLSMLGDGPQAKELRTLALALDLGEAVDFFGYCDDVLAGRQGPRFCLPSPAEGNSMPFSKIQAQDCRRSHRRRRARWGATANALLARRPRGHWRTDCSH
jgi:glycosyltransferase involved in cell wall biosynthesis